MKIILLLLSLTAYSQQVILSAGKNEFSIGQVFYLSNGEGIQKPTEILLKIADNKLTTLLYPNPTTGIIRIYEEGTYYLFDFGGKEIKKGEITDKTINIETVANGVYILKTERNKFKIIKQ